MDFGGEKLQQGEACTDCSSPSFGLIEFVVFRCVMSIMSLNLICAQYWMIINHKHGEIIRTFQTMAKICTFQVLGMIKKNSVGHSHQILINQINQWHGGRAGGEQ
jgi:hypothetical protein